MVMGNKNKPLLGKYWKCNIFANNVEKNYDLKVDEDDNLRYINFSSMGLFQNAEYDIYSLFKE